MSAEYRISWRYRQTRRFLQAAFRIIFRLIARVRVSGLEHVPAKGAYLLVFNHVSIFDPPFILAFWPTMPEVLGAVEIWDRPGQSVLVRLYGGIPIRRGEVDRGAMQQMILALRSGYPLMVSPEGGRSHSPGMRRAKAGAVYLLEKTGVPILPVGVIGTTDDFFLRAARGERPLLELIIGESFSLPGADGIAIPREARQRQIDLVMERVARLLPREYRGVYGGGEMNAAISWFGN